MWLFLLGTHTDIPNFLVLTGQSGISNSLSIEHFRELLRLSCQLFCVTEDSTNPITKWIGSIVIRSVQSAPDDHHLLSSTLELFIFQRFLLHRRIS